MEESESPAEIKKQNWEQEINELMKYFKSADLPECPFEFKPAHTIMDISKFLNTHFKVVKHNNGVPAFLPYLQRLQDLKAYIEEGPFR